MQYYYGDKTPLRVLDEIDFWKHQESEHTSVIRQVVPNLENTWVEQLKNWELAFAEAQGIAVRYIEAVNRANGAVSPAILESIKQLTVFSMNQSISWIAFLHQMNSESKAVRGNDAAVAVINHIRRESEYFIGILTTSLNYL